MENFHRRGHTLELSQMAPSIQEPKEIAHRRRRGWRNVSLKFNTATQHNTSSPLLYLEDLVCQNVNFTGRRRKEKRKCLELLKLKNSASIGGKLVSWKFYRTTTKTLRHRTKLKVLRRRKIATWMERISN